MSSGPERRIIARIGNSRTRHVSSYPTLSGGDRTTYFKIVRVFKLGINHEKRNTSSDGLLRRPVSWS
jgi:hypothetical protein